MTKIFEHIFDEKKKSAADALIFFGNNNKADSAILDLEMRRSDFYEFYEAGQESKQVSINHIREYLITGMQCAPENSEYWLALRDCLSELDRIIRMEK